ncbi:MAG TPA: hypothetical protein VL261_10640 [Nitrospira sp.]|jgi:hypothetical protein|nr:hypothetical protein [Nitrospira sp.]
MATFFFHEETLPPDDAGHSTLVRYYYDDIAAEALTRSFRLLSSGARMEFIDNERIPLADLRPDLKVLVRDSLTQRERSDLRLAS